MSSLSWMSPEEGAFVTARIYCFPDVNGSVGRICCYYHKGTGWDIHDSVGDHTGYDVLATLTRLTLIICSTLEETIFTVMFGGLEVVVGTSLTI